MRPRSHLGTVADVGARGPARPIVMPRREVASMAKEETKKDIKKGEKEK
jgi:hypothetical protein